MRTGSRFALILIAALSVASTASATAMFPTNTAQDGKATAPAASATQNSTIHISDVTVLVFTNTNTTHDANRTVEFATLMETQTTGMYSVSVWTRDYFLMGTLATGHTGTTDEGCVRYSIPEGKVELALENCISLV